MGHRALVCHSNLYLIFFVICQVCQALKEAEVQWHMKQNTLLEEQSSGSQRLEELQEEVADLQTRLEQASREQAALLKAELAGARAAWNRDKQHELSAIHHRGEQAYQSKLQEQGRKLEQALQQAREDVALQKKELLLQMESKLLQRTEEQRRRTRDELLAELQAALAEVQAQFLTDKKTDERGTEDMRAASGATSEGTVTHIIQTSCRDAISKAISQAKEEWRKVSVQRVCLSVNQSLVPLPSTVHFSGKGKGRSAKQVQTKRLLLASSVSSF